jgi:adenosylcobyric acid synthase
MEGPPGQSRGLDLIPIQTTLQSDKVLTRTEATWISNDQTVAGYEIHMGTTARGTQLQPLLKRRDGSEEGAINHDGTIWGTYLHGLFDNSAFRRAFLSELSPERALSDTNTDSIHVFKDRQYDLLAQHFETYLDMERLQQIIKT